VLYEKGFAGWTFRDWISQSIFEIGRSNDLGGKSETSLAKKNVCKERLNFTIRLSITKCFFMLQKVNHSLSLSVAVGFASRPRTIFNGG